MILLDGKETASQIKDEISNEVYFMIDNGMFNFL